MATFSDRDTVTAGSGPTRGTGRSRVGNVSGRQFSNFSADRTVRTNAGNNRIYGDRKRGRSIGPRPIEEFVFVIGNMRRELSKLPPHHVRQLGGLVRDEVKRQGRPYRIKGRTGEKYRLSAKMERSRRVLGSTSSGKKVLGGTSGASVSVVGDPRGFWGIVEHGSKRHLIVPRRNRGGRYTTRGATGAFIRDAERGNDSFRPGGRPLRIKPGGKHPGGFAAWVMHPGHRPLGRPWARAMRNSRRIVTKYHADYTRDVLLAAWSR
jgi:hypothetical protein